MQAIGWSSRPARALTPCYSSSLQLERPIRSGRYTLPADEESKSWMLIYLLGADLNPPDSSCRM
jgi:hypothetical protein